VDIAVPVWRADDAKVPWAAVAKLDVGKNDQTPADDSLRIEAEAGFASAEISVRSESRGCRPSRAVCNPETLAIAVPVWRADAARVPWAAVAKSPVALTAAVPNPVMVVCAWVPVWFALASSPVARVVRVSSIPIAIPPSMTTTLVLAVKAAGSMMALDESLTSGMVYFLS